MSGDQRVQGWSAPDIHLHHIRVHYARRADRREGVAPGVDLAVAKALTVAHCRAIAAALPRPAAISHALRLGVARPGQSHAVWAELAGVLRAFETHFATDLAEDRAAHGGEHPTKEHQ